MSPRVALVAGGAKPDSIGFAVAQRLLGEGCEVAVADLYEPGFAQLPQCLCVRTDASDPGSVQAMVERVVARLGTIHIRRAVRRRRRVHDRRHARRERRLLHGVVIARQQNQACATVHAADRSYHSRFTLGERSMKRSSIVIGVILALLSAPLAAQTFRHELSFFGSFDYMDEPVNVDTTLLHIRYGHFFSEQLVGTIGLSRSSFEGAGPDVSSTALTAGAKYYFGPLRRATFVPFLEGSVGFATVDFGANDETDLTWEIGGGGSYFISDSTSADVSLRWYHTDTSASTEGMRIFLGLTTRF